MTLSVPPPPPIYLLCKRADVISIDTNYCSECIRVVLFQSYAWNHTALHKSFYICDCVSGWVSEWVRVRVCVWVFVYLCVQIGLRRICSRQMFRKCVLILLVLEKNCALQLRISIPQMEVFKPSSSCEHPVVVSTTLLKSRRNVCPCMLYFCWSLDLYPLLLFSPNLAYICYFISLTNVVRQLCKIVLCQNSLYNQAFCRPYYLLSCSVILGRDHVLLLELQGVSFIRLQQSRF